MGKRAKQRFRTRKRQGSGTPALQHSSTPTLQGLPAVFIDRDGTLNEMVYDETHGLLDSPRRPEQVRLVKGAAEFLKGLKRAGFLTVIVTNQPGVAKGTLTLDELYAVNRTVARLLEARGAAWDDLLFCPHHPRGIRKRFAMRCACRKPKPGMLLQAAKDHDIDLRRSWIVGDGLNDVQAGRAAGCRAILVTKLKLDQVERFFGLRDARPTATAADLKKALAIVRGRAKSLSGNL